MKKIIFTIIILAWSQIYALATPAINGVSSALQAGANVTIAGTSFGANTATRQWLGPNIEDGIVDEEISLGSGWSKDTTSTSRQSPIYSSTRAHSGTKSIKSYFPETSQYTSGFWYDFTTPTDGYIYSTWWVYIENIGTPTITYAQWKLFRITPDSEMGGGIYHDQENNWYWAQQLNGINSTFAGGNYLMTNYCLSQSTPSYDETCYAGTTSVYRPYGVLEDGWYRIEVIAQESTPGEQDGTISVKLFNGINTGVDFANYIGNTRTRTDNSPRWAALAWENYIGNGLDSADIYIDDVFVQVGSMARVEIGNSPTWEGCTIREIQIPTSWSDTSISITANLGAFQSTSELYLYVVADDGSVNANGYRINSRRLFRNVRVGEVEP